MDWTRDDKLLSSRNDSWKFVHRYLFDSYSTGVINFLVSSAFFFFFFKVHHIVLMEKLYDRIFPPFIISVFFD